MEIRSNMMMFVDENGNTMFKDSSFNIDKAKFCGHYLIDAEKNCIESDEEMNKEEEEEEQQMEKYKRDHEENF